MSLLKEFEVKTKVLAKDLTEKKLIEIMETEEFSYFFSNSFKAVELFDEIILEVKNPIFIKELNTVRHTFNLLHIEKLLTLLFAARESEEIDDKKFQTRIISNFNSDDPLFAISTLACILVSKYELEIIGNDEYFEIFKKNISSLDKIFESLGRVENSYRFRTEVLDFLYTLREEYFIEFNKDLLESADWLERELQILNTFEESFINANEIDSVDIPPNSLGLIDITKLPKD